MAQHKKKKTKPYHTIPKPKNQNIETEQHETIQYNTNRNNTNRNKAWKQKTSQYDQKKTHTHTTNA
jgi:hypothetical protein